MSSSILDLQSAIRSAHGCASNHLNTLSVRADLAGKAWASNVEVFALIGHPKAKYGYAWRDPRDGHIATALQIPPIVSPRTAVLAAFKEEAIAGGL